MHDASCIGINYAHRFPKCFRSLHTLLGFLALHFVSPIQLLSLYHVIQFRTCTRIPCRDSHCESGLVRCSLLHDTYLPGLEQSAAVTVIVCAVFKANWAAHIDIQTPTLTCAHHILSMCSSHTTTVLAALWLAIIDRHRYVTTSSSPLQCLCVPSCRQPMSVNDFRDNIDKQPKKNTQIRCVPTSEIIRRLAACCERGSDMLVKEAPTFVAVRISRRKTTGTVRLQRVTRTGQYWPHVSALGHCVVSDSWHPFNISLRTPLQTAITT